MDSITSNLTAIALVLAGLCVVLMLVLQALQISRLRQRLDMLTRGSDGASLEGVIGAHLETVHQVGRDLDELTARTAVLESSARHHFARLGLVRFNPFPDTGGNQSFALALLDESESGFVVSSLHSRTATRIYAKAVMTGKAETSLSAEETEAMDLARARVPVRPAAPTARATGGRTASLPSVPASADASASASAAKAAPAAAQKAAPASSAAPTGTAAPTRPAAPTRTAAPVATSDRKSASGSETTGRTVAAKGQSKGQEVAATDPLADSERTGRKPGRPTAGESTSGQRTDTRGS
ncbi:MAG: DUF4446 family protein [Candidatus Limnocylindrales bacterium]